MSVNGFLPTVWGSLVQTPLRKALVFAQPGVVNREYEGDIREAGDSVRIGMLSRPAVTAYTRNTDMTIAPLGDAQTTLLVDQSPSFAFQVDDVDQAQARPELVGPALAEAAYALADDQDAYIAGLYTDAGGAVGSAGSPKTDLGTVGNAYVHLATLAQTLSEANVPKAGRWVAVPPWFAAKLLMDDRFVKTGSAEAESRLQNGIIGRAAGFAVLESNNVSNDSTTWRILAGSDRAITVADQLSRVEAARMEKRFADLVKGLLLYGARVVRPEALACLYANKA